MPDKNKKRSGIIKEKATEYLVHKPGDKHSSHPDFEKRKDNIKLLKSFSDLPKGWNGNGAKSISLSLINRCIDLISFPDLNYQPDIFPTARESIQFEYEKPDGSYLEIEVYEDNISYLYITKNGEETEHESADWQDILRLIYEFHTTG